jgi:hypothetical protein
MGTPRASAFEDEPIFPCRRGTPPLTWVINAQNRFSDGCSGSSAAASNLSGRAATDQSIRVFHCFSQGIMALLEPHLLRFRIIHPGVDRLNT